MDESKREARESSRETNRDNGVQQRPRSGKTHRKNRFVKFDDRNEGCTGKDVLALDDVAQETGGCENCRYSIIRFLITSGFLRANQGPDGEWLVTREDLDACKARGFRELLHPLQAICD